MGSTTFNVSNENYNWVCVKLSAAQDALPQV